MDISGALKVPGYYAFPFQCPFDVSIDSPLSLCNPHIAPVYNLKVIVVAMFFSMVPMFLKLQEMHPYSLVAEAQHM